MDNNQNGRNGFSYTYSAKEQAELRRIREKYAPPAAEEDKMARLRRLDASVTGMAQAVAILMGIVGALFLGVGMSLLMTDLGELLSLNQSMTMVLGLATGVAGGLLIGLAYPVYTAIVKQRRKKLAPEIFRLTDELMK